jgi:hypothetical protein
MEVSLLPSEPPDESEIFSSALQKANAFSGFNGYSYNKRVFKCFEILLCNILKAHNSMLYSNNYI